MRYIVMTTWKCASMFLWELCKDVAEFKNSALYGPNHKDDHENYIPESEISRADFWKNENFVAGPIRAVDFLPSDHSILKVSRAFIHLRDPRDTVVSAFFSHVYSHPRAEGKFNPSDETRATWEEQGIDAHVVSMADNYAPIYENYVNISQSYGILITKYEDMIFNTELFFEQISSSLGLGDDFRAHLNRKYKDEFKIDGEDIYRHKRQMLPGDHKRKLKKETIDILNKKFEKSLERLGYPTTP